MGDSTDRMTATAFFGVNKLLPRIYVLYICRRGDVPCKVGAASVQGREMKGTPFPRARRFERCHKQDTLSHVRFCFASFSSKRTRSHFNLKIRRHMPNPTTPEKRSPISRALCEPQSTPGWKVWDSPTGSCGHPGLLKTWVAALLAPPPYSFSPENPLPDMGMGQN